MIYLTKIKSRLFKGHERTTKANKNILLSFLIKGGSIACQFALVPMTLHYLDKERYGIWLTISSIVGWFSFFDIGIGNGLRNKLSEALAKGDTALARIYVSTSYACVTAIFLSLLAIFYVIGPLLNWSAILNTSPGLEGELSRIMLIVASFFCFQFIFSLIGNILFAHQEPALNNLIFPLSNLISLITIFILTRTTSGSLFWVSIVFSASPVLVLLAFNILFLGKKFRDIAPRWKDVHFKYSKNLFGLGVQFFIIQIAFLVLYSSANLILTQLFGPQEVTVYNVAYKYFTIALMVNGIITATYWSAFTDAYTRGEMTWISNAIRKLEYITYLLMGMIVVSTLISGTMFHLWLGDSVHVPVSMRTVMCVYALISLISAPQHIFLNGTGKVRLQLYSAIFSIIMTVPLALFFCKVLDLGPEGVVLAMTCTTLPVTILYKIQYSRIMKGNASGIWNK